ncbi:MAG: hypothetical protein QNJ11_02640 [Woeseiaceae bacterium]|nr:hypothetical protein [Woeseiaceae bacterium]
MRPFDFDEALGTMRLANVGEHSHRKLRGFTVLSGEQILID